MKINHCVLALAFLWLTCITPSADAQPLPGWPFITEAAVNSSPAIGDLNRDGYPDVVAAAEDGKVYAIDYRGKLLPGWPQERGAQDFLSTNSSPAIADINMDGQLEVIIGDSNGGVYVWKRDGQALSGWPKLFSDSEVYASPAIGNIDPASPGLEIVISVRQKTRGTGYVHVFRPNGTELNGWPKEISHAYVDWSATLGDINRSVPGLEIFLPVNDSSLYESTTYGFYGNGASLPGWPITLVASFWGSAAVADINQDGSLEIVQGNDLPTLAWRSTGVLLPGWENVTSGSYVSPAITDLDPFYPGYEIIYSDIDHIYAKHRNGSDAPGWPIALSEYAVAAPAVADVNNDKRADVVAGLSDGKVYAWNYCGVLLPGWPLTTILDAPLFSSPAIADLNRDGKLEVVVGSSSANIYAWTVGPRTKDPAPWPMFHHDVQRTGFYPLPFATPTYPAQDPTPTPPAPEP